MTGGLSRKSGPVQASGFVATGVLTLLLSGGLYAQGGIEPILVRMRALEASQARILEQLEFLGAQLQELRKSLGDLRPRLPPPAAAAVPPTPLSIHGAALKGNAAARVVIIAYSDFQCPYCGTFARGTLPNLSEAYIDNGKVLLAFRHLPLEKLHPLAFKAAVASECAQRQNKFWPMHDELFNVPATLDENDILRRAKTVGLDEGLFTQCLSGDVSAKVRNDLNEAQALGITGTPTFLIGYSEPGAKVRILRRLTGAQPFAVFKGILDSLLSARAPD